MTLTTARNHELEPAFIQPTKAISYIRVSTKEQAERDGDPEGYSIPAQREAIARKADTRLAATQAHFDDVREFQR